MGCALSSSSSSKRDSPVGGENDAVSLCRERKRLVKKAVKQRQVFAEAHSSYIQSLSSVSSAIALFVARYSARSSSQFLITFAPNSDSTTHTNSNSEEAETEGEQSGVCEHFYDEGEPHQHQVEVEGEMSKWDFFNLLDTTNNPKKGESKERKVVKEEGKRKEKKNGNGNENGDGKGKGKGRELLEALKDVEDFFMRAYEAGLDVSRMLEVNQIPTQPAFLDPQDNSSRKRSISSRSPSCKSLLSSSSMSTSSTLAESRGDRKSLLSSSSENSSTWTETRTDVDGFGGMVSGSHSYTLGRLYAWEKKLYHEVKTGDQSRKAYKRKCSQLQKKDVEEDELCPSKATLKVRDLYHQILVAFQRAESISKEIEKLRDEELQPQLVELLHGLIRTWKAMLETHEIQKKIMREIRSFSSPDHEKFCNGSHRLAMLQLEAVIQNWLSCFSDYVSAQKAYVKSLDGWLSKFVDAEAEYYYKGSSSLPPIRFNGPPLMVICHNWLTFLERLPDKAVKQAMKSLARDIQALWVQQGEEQQQKRKVDGLAKEMDRKILAFKRAEDKALMPKHIDDTNVKDQIESLNEKKNQLDMFRQRIEVEKERYQSSVQVTEQLTMKGLQMGFSSVFESLAEFSRASVKVYADLVTYSQSAKDY